MSAACRRFPTPSTTPSRSWAQPISRCRTITGATGGRQRTLECLRRMKDREEIAQALAASGYIADNELATAISLMQLLRRPLLLEGEAGGGQAQGGQGAGAGPAARRIRPPCCL